MIEIGILNNIFRNRFSQKVVFKILNAINPNISFGDFEKAFELYFYGQNSDIVTEETAIKFGAVSTCVGVISQDIGLLPFEIRKYKNTKNIAKGSDPAINHPLYNVLKNKANDFITAYNFKERIMSDILLSGNCYCYKEINARGQVIKLIPLEWSKIEVKEDEKTKEIYYEYRENNGEPIKFIRDEIFHISGYGNGFIGKSPVKIKMESIKTGLNADNFINLLYKQGLNSGVAITLPGRIKDKEGLRKELREKYQGLANAGQPLILEDGMTVQKLVMPLKEAQFVENKKFTARDIASWYRVPPKLIGDHEFSTYSNNEQQELDYVKHTLLPWTERLENFVNAYLLTPRNIYEGYFAQFDYNTLLKADSKTRAEVNHIRRNDGVISANEWRAFDGINPRSEKEADELYINGNMRNVNEPYKGVKGGENIEKQSEE